MRIDGDEITVTLGDGEEEESYTVPEGYEPLSPFACNGAGGLVIAVGRDENLLSPLILADGELATARDLPPALEPSWIDGDRLLLRIVDPQTGTGPRVYHLEEGGFEEASPILPGQNPAWAAGLGEIAVQAGPGGGFDRLGIYGLSLDAALEGRIEAAEWELISSVPIEPRQLNPAGTTFVFATEAQENQQRDIQAIETDGSDARTLVATPLEEYRPVWTPEGDLLFLRRELLDPGQDEAAAEIEVVQHEIESGEEVVLARAKGISALAACSAAD